MKGVAGEKAGEKGRGRGGPPKERKELIVENWSLQEIGEKDWDDLQQRPRAYANTVMCTYHSNT